MNPLDPRVKAALEQEALRRGLRLEKWPRAETAEDCPEHFHSGQIGVWNDETGLDIVACAGTQGGKTTMGAPWLLREIKRTAKYGLETPTRRAAYIYAGPTLELLANQALPEFDRLFVAEWGLGRLYRGNKPVFQFSPEGAKRLCGVDIPISVIFAYATDSGNLESVTALGGVWDESGQQDNKLASYRAYNRRLKAARSMGKKIGVPLGRRLFTTTPYEWGWFKEFVVDPAIAGNDGFSFHNWPSWFNPMVDEEECRRELELGMPVEEWQMMYLGEYTRPRGKIYDCFNRETNTCSRFPIPDDWERSIGVDFGTNNTAAVFLAREESGGHPTGRWIMYRTYHEGGKTIKEHSAAMTDGLRGRPIAAGGSHGEEGTREAYLANGLWIREPYENSVEDQIRLVYTAIKTGRLVIFDDLEKILHEIEMYSRELDDYGNPTDRIRDKSAYHRLDALRYIATVIFQDFGARVEGPGWISRYKPVPLGV